MTAISGSPAAAWPASPYAGLAFFTEDSSALFFGRDTERRALIGNLRAARLTLLYADTGVGKSSLLRAGVAARLGELARARRAADEPAGYVPVVFDSWRDDPVTDFVEALEEAIAPYVLTDRRESLPRESVSASLESAARQTGSLCLVMLDQFEEYLLYRLGEERSPSFADHLAECVNRLDLRAHILVAVREDRYAALGDLFQGRLANVYANYLQLGHLTRADAREAITGPIDVQNMREATAPITIEPELVEAVLDEVRTGQVVFAERSVGVTVAADAAEDDEIEAPYLQLVMTTLWDRELSGGSRVLRRQTLTQLGGAAEIVHTHMAGVLNSLPAPQQDLAAEIFDHLVTPSGTKIVHRISDLAAYSGRDPGAVKELVDDLVNRDQRLLRPIPPAAGDGDEPRVEIFHDVLAPAIVAWQAERQESRLQEDKRRAERAARRDRVRAVRSLAIAIIAVLAMVAAVYAAIVAHRARDRARAAEASANSRVLADAANSALADGDLRRGVLFAIAAYRTARTNTALQAVSAAAQRTFAMTAFADTGTGGAEGVSSVAVSPDGQQIASAGTDGTVRFFDVATRRTATISPHLGDEVTSVAYRPGGSMLAIAGDQRGVALWDLQRGRAACVLPSTGVVESVAYNRTGNVLATGDAAHDVEISDVARCSEIRRIRLANPVNSVAFAPDQSNVAVGEGHNVALIDWRAPRRRVVLRTPGEVYAVAYDPAGNRFAAAQSDGDVSVFTSRGDRVIRTWRAPAGVESVAFNSSGNLLAGALDDDTVRVWDVPGGGVVSVLRGHSQPVTSVAFGPGTLLASGGEDGHLITWSTSRFSSRQLVGRAKIGSLAFDRGGDELAAPAGNAIDVWNTRSGARRTFTDHLHRVKVVAVSKAHPALVAVGDSRGRVSVFDLDSGQPIAHTIGTGTVFGAAFSPNGDSLALGGSTGVVTIWDLRTGRRLELAPHDGVVQALAFSPNGRYLAAATASGTVALWTLSGRATLRTFGDNTSPLYSVAFAPDGDRLASAGNDGSIQLWEPTTARRLGQPLSASQDAMLEVAFDGLSSERLLSLSQDGSVMDWDLKSRLGVPVATMPQGPGALALSPDGRLAAVSSPGGWITLLTGWPSSVPANTVIQSLCSLVGGDLSPAEWRQSEPDLAYQRPCES